MLKRIAALVLLSCAATPAFAQAASSAEIDWVELALQAIGGLALFLFGVSILADALRGLSGGRFQRLLERSSGNRFSALASGTLATIALDSSSVAIILLIALIDAGLIGFGAALPVILGANIGTTISSQVFAWSIDQWSPLLLAAGLLWRVLANGYGAKQAGTVLFGIGLVLFALHTIGNAVEPLEDHPEIIAWLRQFENPLLGVAVGALATVAIQWSSAMMGIIIVLASGGLLSLPAGVAIMLGAEIGTCADTLAATVGRSRAAVRTGVFHLLFNIVSVAIGLIFVQQLAAFGSATASDTGQQLANAHVLFNVAGALLFLPFVKSAARLLERVIPDRGDTEPTAEPAAAAAE